MRVEDAGITLYGHAPGSSAPSAGETLQTASSLRVGDRTWTVTYLPSDAFLEEHFLSDLWWLLLGSFAFTGLASAGLLMLTGQTLRTEGVVAERTRELMHEAAQRKRMIEMRELQNQVLAQIAGQEPLDHVLETLVRMTEASHPGLKCSIQLLNPEKKRFALSVAPSLPPEYAATIVNYDIGPGVGSCGTAAATGERVIVEGSEPIIADREILGSFAFYHREARQPGPAELEFIRDLAGLAGLAIVRRRSETQIERLAFYDVLTEIARSPPPAGMAPTARSFTSISTTSRRSTTQWATLSATCC
jgi:hypothetical protein